MMNSYTNVFHIKKELLDSSNQNKSILDVSESDKVKKKINKLSKRVLSKHQSLTNAEKRILKEKRLNSIFNKNKYYNIYNEIKSKNKDRGKLKKNTISFLINDKANNDFLEKYKELYGLAMNNKNKNIEYNNMPIIYYLNKLKNENNLYSYNDSKVNNSIINYNNKKKRNTINYNNSINYYIRSLSLSKTKLRKKCDTLRNEILGNLGNNNIPNFNLNINNNSNMIKNKNLKNDKINDNKTLFFDNTLNPRKLTYSLISNQNNKNNKYHSFDIPKRISSPKNNKLSLQADRIEPYVSNKQFQFNYKYDNLNKKNYYDYYKYSYKPKSISTKMNRKKKYFNNLYKNVSSNDIKKFEVIDYDKFLFSHPKDRLNYKLNSFKTRLNLLSMK